MFLLKSYFIGGFECATGQNSSRQKLDQVVATEHDRNMLADYRRLRQAGINVVREGVRWPEIDRGSHYDFSSLDQIIECSTVAGVQVIYDLFHYGYPSGLDIFSPRFPHRFSEYCRAVAQQIAIFGDGPYYFTPVNEPSYFAWAAGDACLFAPHACGRSFELKVQLARAAIAGIDAIRSVIPNARIVNVDPICRVVPPKDRPDLADEAHWFNENVVFEAWDMISGRIMPELGGSPSHLDIVGLNYYWTNQWEHTRPGSIVPDNDPRKWPLRDLVRWVWHRYKHEMIVTETAHVGRQRAKWIRTVANEVEAVLDEGIPLRGVCVYPVLGMPEWHDPKVWARMGLYDLESTPEGLKRVPNRPALRALAEAQGRLEGLGFSLGGVPGLLSGEAYPS